MSFQQYCRKRLIIDGLIFTGPWILSLVPFLKEFLLLSDRQWACLSQCRPSRAPVDPRVVLSPVSIPAARLLHVPQALEMQKLYSIIEPRPKPRTNSYLSTIYIGMWAVCLSPGCLFFDSCVEKCVCVMCEWGWWSRWTWKSKVNLPFNWIVPTSASYYLRLTPNLILKPRTLKWITVVS